MLATGDVCRAVFELARKGKPNTGAYRVCATGMGENQQSIHSRSRITGQNPGLGSEDRKRAEAEIEACSCEVVSLFLWTLRQMRDLRRYNVTINNIGGQVNAASDGGKQVNAVVDG